MIRSMICCAAALALTVTMTASGVRAQAPRGAASTSVSSAEAKDFLGDWRIAAEGMQGPITINLTLKDQDGRTAGDIGADGMPPSQITEVRKSGDTVTLRYSFEYEGNEVPTVVTLKPDGETLEVSFDFADGAFIMPGTATRKKS